MGQHTPEPWGMGTREDGTICGDGGRGLVICRDAGNRPMSPVDKARAIACINALAGIPDPAAFVKAARELADKAESMDELIHEDRGAGEYVTDPALAAFRAADRPVPTPAAGE